MFNKQKDNSYIVRGLTLSIIIYILFLSSFNNECHAQIDMDVLASCGLPAGILKLSANAHFSVNFTNKYHITPQIMLNETYSFKTEKKYIETYGESFSYNDSRIFYNDLTVFALAMREIRLLKTGVYPFISAGFGFHLIHSWTNEHSKHKDKSKTILTTKFHTFAGLKIKSYAEFYMFAMGRATYPSDIIFDSLYLGIGFSLI